MRTDVTGIGEVDERNQGRRLGGVQEVNEGGSGVIRLVDGEVRVVAEPLALCLRDISISRWYIEEVYCRLKPDANRMALRGVEKPTPRLKMTGTKSGDLRISSQT